MEERERELRGILPIAKLDENIVKLLDKEVSNTELLKELNRVFTQKNLNLKTIPCLFDETKDVSDMTDIEKIAFSEVCHEVLERQDKTWYKDFDVKKYFSDQSLMEYDTYINVEEPVTEIFFPIARKKGDYDYRTELTGKQVYEYMKHMLLLYNKKTQRATTIKKLGTEGTVTRQISLNRKGTKEIKDLVLAGDFEESEVILNVRLIKGKKPQLEFNELFKDTGIGELLIIPNYDRESDYTTYVEIIDGFHRLKGIYDAVEEYKEETGKWLDFSIGAKIVLADQDRALRIVAQTFKRTDTNKDFLKGIEQTDISRFLDKLINNSRELKDNVEYTIEECKLFNKLTYKSVLVKTLEKLDIKYSDISEVAYLTEDMAEKLDLIINLVKKRIKKDLNYSYLLEPNMFIIYLKASYLLTKIERGHIKAIEEMIDKLTSIEKDELNKFGIGKPRYQINNIFNLINEV